MSVKAVVSENALSNSEGSSTAGAVSSGADVDGAARFFFGELRQQNECRVPLSNCSELFQVINTFVTCVSDHWGST